MKTDTTKQRLIDTGLFTERGCFLVVESKSGAETRLRFNSAGELTAVDMDTPIGLPLFDEEFC